MPMLIPIFAGVTSFLISFAFLPFVITFSKRKRLLSRPGKRRIHKRITPSLGGVAIFFGFTISCLCWSLYPKLPTTFLLLPILIIPFIIGLLDDLIQLKPLAKLIAQWMTASLVFLILDIRLTSFYGLGTEFAFPLVLSYALTLFTVVFITNSLNLIDGIDGLAATLSSISCLFFGSWFLFTGVTTFAILSFALAGAILAFLFKNWEPSNIFMGDTGSLVIGTMLSVIVIKFINLNFALNSTDPLKFSSSIGTAICAIIIPVADTCRIIVIRLYNRVSLFVADKRHIHHALIRIGLTHRQAVYILTLTHVSMIGAAILLRSTNQWLLIGVTVSVTGILCVVLDRLILKKLDVKEDVREVPD